MFRKYSKYMVLMAALALMVPLCAFAHSRNEHKVTLPYTVQIGTTLLKAGSYKVEWKENGNGPSINVSFLRNDKTIATTQGRLVEKNEKPPSDTFYTSTTGKTKRLDEIDLRGSKDALVFASTKTVKK
jgi:hypothetical protein